MAKIDPDLFEKEVTCTYREEIYSVRDNGAVLRHRKEGSRLRQLDEQWTFGHPNKRDGYMYISSIAVHRIIATAFHGPKPSDAHVVDHIDSNRRNNRQENLRWVTRLENILLNPITARRVELAYGSLENFFANPGAPLPGKLDSNFEWMRTVTKTEAEDSRKRLMEWASSGNTPSGGLLGDWLYNPLNDQDFLDQDPDHLIDSKTPGAIQKNWKTPSEFPLCPSDIGANALADYCQRLEEGVVFACNDFSESIVVSAVLSESFDALLVMCNNPEGIKPWLLARVSIDDQLFLHENLGSFFTLEGVTKEFILAQGLEWEGGDTFDDNC